MSKKYWYFLGGKDLEMAAIRSLLKKLKLPFSDKGLGWGAKLSDYADEIAKAIRQGYAPVLVELEVDCVIVDHHGEWADRDPSLLQICEMAGVKPSRRMKTIAANDAGWIPGMREIGASDKEIAKIRFEDRKAQGFTEKLERLSVELAKTAQIDLRLGLAVLTDLPISKFAGIKDYLALEHNIYRSISLAQSEGEGKNGEMEFQAHGVGGGAICKLLAERYGGWSGGDGLYRDGAPCFWGGYPDNPQKVIELIKHELKKSIEK